MKFNPPVTQPTIAISNVSLVLRMSFQFKATSPTAQPADEASNSANVDAPPAALSIPPPPKRKKKLSAKAIAAAAEAADEAAAEAADEAAIAAAAASKPAKKAPRAKDKKPRIEWTDKMVVAMYDALLGGVKIGLRAQSGYHPRCWTLAIAAVQEATEQDLTVQKPQCRSKHSEGRKLWHSWKAHSSHSGWSVDANDVPVSDTDVMAADFEANPSHLKWQHKTPLAHKQMYELFYGIVATGQHSCTAQQMQQVLEENEEDSGGNAGLVLDEDDVDEVEDLDEDFSQAVQDYEEPLAEDDNFISDNGGVDEDREGEDNEDNTGRTSVSTAPASNRSASSTPVSTAPSQSSTPAPSQSSTPAPPGSSTTPAQAASTAASATPLPQPTLGPKKPSNINLRKRAAEAAARRSEENVKKGRTKKSTLAETAAAVSKEIAATRKLLTEQIMQSTAPAVVVLLQERATTAFTEFERVLSIDEQLAVRETFEIDSRANSFLLTSGAIREAWVSKVVGRTVQLGRGVEVEGEEEEEEQEADI